MATGKINTSGIFAVKFSKAEVATYQPVAAHLVDLGVTPTMINMARYALRTLTRELTASNVKAAKPSAPLGVKVRG